MRLAGWRLAGWRRTGKVARVDVISSFKPGRPVESM